MNRITSQKHTIMDTLRQIQTEKGRIETGAFHVEGNMIVSRALDYGLGVRFVICTERFAASPDAQPIFEAAQLQRVALYITTEGLISKLVPAKPTPGVVACVDRTLHTPDALLESTKEPLLVMIDKCENPDNLGMLLRSLDAAGVDGVILTEDSVDPFNRLCVRASRGSVLSLKLAVTNEPDEFVATLQNQGFRVIASSAHGASGIWDTDFRGKTVIVVGNEHTGVRETIRTACDSLITIPMAGKMESLNIAVAGAIIAYEAVRQRSCGK